MTKTAPAIRALSRSPNAPPCVAVVSPAGVASFNRAWPCSTLRASRAYWFEFDSQWDLVDTDCPESDDGPAAAAMADDCKAFLQEGTRPEWAPEGEAGA